MFSRVLSTLILKPYSFSYSSCSHQSTSTQLKHLDLHITGSKRQFTSIMEKITPVTHCIFDMDGLLLDTVNVYESIRKQVLADFEVDFDFETNMATQGMLSSEVAKFVIAKFDLPITEEDFTTRCFKLGVEYFANAQLLPDTEVIYERIISEITESYKKQYTSDIRLKVLGTNELTTAEVVVRECQLPLSVEEFIKIFHKLQNDQLGTADPLPGVERLLRHLHKKNVPIAVATSSGSASVAVKTARHKELFSLFHHIVMGSSDAEVKNGKPAPDIFRVCASRFDDKPSCDKCLVFEDAPNGVTGARAAGMQAVMIPDEHLPEERTKNATIVLKSLLDFKPELFGLPAFD